MSQPGPHARLIRRLAALPPDAARRLDAALESAEVRAARLGVQERVLVSFKYGPEGVCGIDLTAVIEWRPEAPTKD